MTKITLLYPAKTYSFDHLVLSLPTVELGGVHFLINYLQKISNELSQFDQEALAAGSTLFSDLVALH